MTIRRNPSIALRLTLLLGVIVFALSCISGYALFQALKREVQRQETTEIAGKLELIEHLIDMQSTPAAVSDLRETLDNILTGHENLRVWLVDDAGKIIYGEGLPVTVGVQSDGEIILYTSDGLSMRGQRVRLSNSVMPDAELTVAVNVQPGGQFLYAFVTALILIGAMWIGATVILAGWAVRHTLMPLRRFSAQAARIHPGNLSLRLPEQGVAREMQELSETFNKMLDRLQLAYEQLEGFNADVAHELRTPLATLIYGTELALSSPRAPEYMGEVLASNLEELEALKTLVNDMLFLARADSGEQACDLEEVSVQEQVRCVVEYYEAALDEGGVELKQEGDSRIQANARLLRRAIANLISNAIKATPKGGVIKITCVEESGEVVVRVHNRGIPIPQSALPRIFDRFYRADDARSRRVEGSGLGLAIVRAIARMHGGHAFAKSDSEDTEVGFTIAHKNIKKM